MARKILTAREQVTMLSPWLREAGREQPDLFMSTNAVDHYKHPYYGHESNYDGDYPSLIEDIVANGVQNPLIIGADNSFAELLDGHHRLEVAKRLGIDKLPVRIWTKENGTSNGWPLEPELKNWLGGQS